MIEAATAGAGDVRPNSVEDLAVLFVGIESVVDEGAEEAAALRGAESDGALHEIAHVAEQQGRSTILEERDQVADAGRPQPDQSRILRLIDSFVDAGRLESGIEFD